MPQYVIGALMLLFGAVPGLAAPSAAPADTAAAPPGRLETADGPCLIGPLTLAQWEAFDPEIAATRRGYEPAPDVIDALRGAPDFSVVCVMGTWCSDSRREVPRFAKVLEEMRAPAGTLRLIAVGHADDPAAAAWEKEHDLVPGTRARYDIERVPTFIVLQDGAELGRIVETPTVSLEADLADILGVRATPAWH